MDLLAILLAGGVAAALGFIAGRLNAAARTARLSAALEHERASHAEKIALLEDAKSDLAASFQALSGEALRANNTAFLELARAQFEQAQNRAKGDLQHLVEPIRGSLERFDGHVRELERARTGAYSTLSEQIRSLLETQKDLRLETGNLVNALRSPSVRGKWGEIQLKRVVEFAGMLPHCDFVQQTTVSGDSSVLRPDLVVRLAGGTHVVVDAKAPLQAYLEALEAKDDETRLRKLADHARQIRDHIGKLSAKSYWSQFNPTPDFVVMFLPGEQFFGAALEQDPNLIEQGATSNVLIATPTTLIALLRTVAAGWREAKLGEDARKISELGRELHRRLATMSDHFAKLGRNLDGAVRSYNETVGSLERRVLVTARRFTEHGAIAAEELVELPPVERTPQALQAPELLPAQPDEPKAA
jgi:DNA recombination protein RmuC